MATPSELYGLIGKKLGHSFSQGHFRKKFAAESLDADYLNFELREIGDLVEVLRAHPNLRGLNVTIPYKSEVLPFLDDLSPEVGAIGACNTIRIREGRLEGFNTDIIGFEEDLKKWIPEGFSGRALILGTGGAAKAVHYVLFHRLLLDEVWFVSRNPGGEGVLSYDALGEIDLSQFPLIINTTPLGMHPDTESAPALAYEQVGPQHYLYDLIYNPSETLFLRKGKERGAAIRNGLGMLIGQAEAAWKIWQE